MCTKKRINWKEEARCNSISRKMYENKIPFALDNKFLFPYFLTSPTSSRSSLKFFIEMIDSKFGFMDVDIAGCEINFWCSREDVKFIDFILWDVNMHILRWKCANHTILTCGFWIAWSSTKLDENLRNIQSF